MSDCRESAKLLALVIGFGLLAHAAAQRPLVGHHQPDGPIVENPPGFHLLLRKPTNKAVYKLGEKIEFEFGCMDVVGQ